MTATAAQRRRMDWGYKFVGVDLATSDHAGGRFRYRPGQWATATPDREFTRGSGTSPECPQFPGDGLCVARTVAGAQSGGARLGTSTMLVVGFLRSDVLYETRDKVRVKRLWVHPDPIDPVAVIVATRANLAGANLAGADLTRAYLAGADLTRADLTRADLAGANLTRADLAGAYLTRADLAGADLAGADLTRADLTRADLAGANLAGADLAGAYLAGANLAGAYLAGAYLAGADLAGDTGYTLPSGWTVAANGYVVRSGS